jgi:hypothetical protein
MKYSIFLILLLMLTVACNATPTAAPQVVNLTATPAATPTLMVAPTQTNTPMPTPTPTPTPTLTPTPQPLAPLYIQGTDFFAEGKSVVMRGAVVTHFNIQKILDRTVTYTALYKKDVDTLKQMGANFVMVQWNSGFIDQSGYIENLVEGLEYAKSQQFRVGLVLHARGRKPDSNWDVLQIKVADTQIITDWNKLLNDPLIAKRIGNAVDIFNPLSEPKLKNLEQDISWTEWKDICERTIKLIRDRIGKPQAVSACSGINWGGDARPALKEPLDLNDVVIEVHPYFSKPDIKTYAAALRAKGIPFFIGELGCLDPPEYIEGLLKFSVANDVSFAIYAMNSDTTDPICSIQTRNGTYSPNGNLARKYFSAEK